MALARFHTFIHQSRYEFTLLLVWICTILIINPLGDFYINDDWAFAQNAKALTEGKLFFHDWAPMTLIAQTAWGALFCKILGYSYTSLRISSLVLGGVGIIYFYKSLLSIGTQHSLAFITTLCLAFNPFYLQNAFSYMTEVPFTALLVVALYHVLGYIHTSSVRKLVWFSIFCMLASLVRQIGLLLPLALLAYSCIQWLTNRKWRPIIFAFVPLVSVLAVLFIYKIWRVHMVGPLPESYGNTSVLLDNIGNGELKKISNIGYSYWAYWGLLCLPILLLSVSGFSIKKYRTIKIVVVVLSLIPLIHFWPQWHRVILGNTLGNLTLGVGLVPDWSYQALPHLHSNDWENLLKGSLILAAALVAQCIYVLIKSVFISPLQTPKHPIFASIAVIGYFVFLMMHRFVFDRYSVVAVPFVLILLIPKKWPKSLLVKVLSVFIFGVLSLFSIAATHDYMARERAWWTGMQIALNDHKLTPIQLQENPLYPGNYAYYDKTNSNYTDTLGDYIFSLSKQDEFESIDSFSYYRFIPPSKAKLFLLREKPLGDTSLQIP